MSSISKQIDATIETEVALRQSSFAKELLEAVLNTAARVIKKYGVTPQINWGTAAGAPAVKAAKAPKAGQRSRAVITPEIKQEVKKLVKAGGLSAAQIGEKLGISQPSVQNIKKALGLTKPHKK